MTPTPKEEEDHDKYEAAMAEDARREALPPDLKELKILVRDLLDLWINNNEEKCFCIGGVPGEIDTPCELCAARLALGKLTDEALERDEKRRAALENVAEKSRLVFGWDQTHAANFFDKPTAKLQIALKELDALTPATQEKERPVGRPKCPECGELANEKVVSAYYDGKNRSKSERFYCSAHNPLRD